MVSNDFRHKKFTPNKLNLKSKYLIDGETMVYQLIHYSNINYKLNNELFQNNSSKFKGSLNF